MIGAFYLVFLPHIPGTTNKTYRHDRTKILLKVAVNTKP